MNLNELVLQMTYAASQAAQFYPPQQVQDNPEGTQDFRTLMDEKRTQAVSVENEGKSTDQAVQQAEPQPKEGLMYLSSLLTQATAGGQNVPFQVVLPTQQAEVQPQVETVLMAAAEPNLSPEIPQVQPTQVQLQNGSVPTAGSDLTISNQNGQPEEMGTMGPVLVQTTTGKENVSVEPAQDQKIVQELDTGFQNVKQEPEADAAQTGATMEQPLFQNREVIPQRVGDAPVLDTQSDSFEPQLTSQIKSALAKGEQHIQLRLTPEHLGQVVVEMSRSPEGVLHVVLHTENEQALKVLTEHSNTLGLMLQSGQQGEVRIEVRSPQSEERPWQQPDQNGGQNQGEQRQQEQRRPRQDSDLFFQQLRLGLTSMEGQ